MNHRRSGAAALGLLACCLLPTGEVRANGLDYLVLLIDRSRSIDEDELRLQRRAYARLLNDPDVISALGEAKVAIVAFDSKAEIDTAISSRAAA